VRGIGLRRGVRTVALAILIDAVMSQGAAPAQADGDAPDPLSGIEPLRPDGADVVYYLPFADAWSPNSLELLPILVRPDGGSGTYLFLRVVMRDVAYSKSTPLQLTIDGQSVTLDLHQDGKVRIDDSGCRRVIKVDLQRQEDLVRRLARAKEIEAAYGEGETRVTRRLTGEDRDLLRRMVALRDAETPQAGVTAHQDTSPEQSPAASGDGFSDPMLIHKASPRYPPQASRRRIGGRVSIQAIVRKDGSVTDPKVFKSTGSECGMEEAALEAVRKWKYEPGRVNGEPVEVSFTIIVDFMMEGVDPNTREVRPKERSPRDPWHP